MKNRKERKHVFLFNANLLSNNRMHVIDAMSFPSLSLFPYSIFTFFCTIYSRYQMPNIFAIMFAFAFFGTTKMLVTFLIFSVTLSITTTLHSCKIWFWFFLWNINLLIIFHLCSQICNENPECKIKDTLRQVLFYLFCGCTFSQTIHRFYKYI